MNQKRTVEDQLRLYADAVDPAVADNTGSAGTSSKRWGPSIQSTWFVAAAAIVVLLGIAVLAQRDPAQQVDTVPFAQATEEPIDGLTATSTPTPGSDANDSIVVSGPPLPDGVPETGDWRPRQDSLVVMMAESTLVQECMAAQGLEYPMPTDQELIDLHGGWRPNGILGIGTEGAARRIGYQSDGWGGFGAPTQAGAIQALSDSDQDAFFTALMDGPLLPESVPTVAGEPIQGGCLQYAYAVLGDYQTERLKFDRILQLGSDETQGARYRVNPLLADAIAQWQECMQRTVAVEADTPNQLARRYAFDAASDPTEREVAVADVRCQQESNLEESFYMARTTQLRAEFGTQVTVFDDYVRFRIRTVNLARQVLADRGVAIPSLD